MSADLLRRAAKVLREATEKATPGPWTGDSSGGVSGTRGIRAEAGFRGTVVASVGAYEKGWPSIADADLIALTHPPVALAMAVLLDTHAEVAESNDEHDGFDLEAIDDTHSTAVNLARAVLREAPDA